MKQFRAFLVKIRKMTHTNVKKYFLTVGAVFVLSATIGSLVDTFLPFSELWMVLRSFLLIPIAGSAFMLGYSFSLFAHDYAVKNRENWIPWRSRYSLMWRYRIAAVSVALGVILQYANGYSPIYTLVSGVLFAGGIGLLAFIRPTMKEAKQKTLGIPDQRDLSYKLYVKDKEEKVSDKNSKKKD